MSAPGTKADHLQSGDRRPLVTRSGHLVRDQILGQARPPNFLGQAGIPFEGQVSRRLAFLGKQHAAFHRDR